MGDFCSTQAVRPARWRRVCQSQNSSRCVLVSWLSGLFPWIDESNVRPELLQSSTENAARHTGFQIEHTSASPLTTKPYSAWKRGLAEITTVPFNYLQHRQKIFAWNSQH